MNSQMLQALLTPRRRGIASLRNHPPGGAGTLADPGTASALGPTIPEQIGATLNPMLERVQDIFPKDNPYGSFIERLIVGDSPKRTGLMAEGYPHQYTGAGPNDPIIRPQIMDLAAALPIGSAATLAKAAVPAVKAATVPAAMITSAAALNRLKAPGYAATSTDDLGAALLGQSLQRQGALDDAMVGGEAGAAALARIGNTAPQQAMELAEQMESAGRSRDEIWTATADMGYPVFRGKDGKLRFEIDDSAMAWDDDQYKRFRRMREGNEMPLADAMTHPELYDAYPKMRDTTLFRGKSQEGGGSAAPYGYEYIRADTGFEGPQADKPDMLSMLGHESQHLIQGGENFARGGDIRLADVPGRSDTVAMKEQLENQVNAAIESNNLQGMNYEDARNMVIETIPELKSARQRIRDTEAIEHLSAYGQYRALAGETEARAVQKRMDMTPEERAARPFYADYDVPEADQIVRYFDGPSAMVTYQGSPHKFDALDPTKIGTGEGAQTFGHGMYVAESKDVAQTYQPRDFDAEEIMMARYKEAESAGDYNRMEQWENAMLHETPDDLRERSLDMDYDEDYRQAAAEVAEELAAIPSTSHLYEIDVPDEDIAKMLDWDAPLSEQPQSVQSAVRGLYDGDVPANNKYGKRLTGADFHQRAVDRLSSVHGKKLLAEVGIDKSGGRPGGAQQLASEYLNALGIPGIKYYDQGSRAAGEGTRNMVLFDDLARRAKVLKRNDETIAQPSVDEFIGKLLED